MLVEVDGGIDNHPSVEKGEQKMHKDDRVKVMTLADHANSVFDC